MEHVNDWCFRDIYKGGLWEDDLYMFLPCRLGLVTCNVDLHSILCFKSISGKKVLHTLL